MKTCRQLSLFLALSTLPLSAQEAKTPAPAAPLAPAQEQPPLPPQSDAPSAEARALARELLDFLAELHALYLAPSRAEAEFHAALCVPCVQAVKLGERARAVGTDHLRRALKATLTEQDRQNMSDSPFFRALVEHAEGNEEPWIRQLLFVTQWTLVDLATGANTWEPHVLPNTVGRSYVDLAERMHAIIFSADTLETKRQALRDLKPMAAHVGKARKMVGERAIREHAARTINEAMEKLAALDEAMADQAACGELLEDLQELAAGQPDPSLPIPAQEVAAGFRATLRELPALAQNTGMSPQDKADALDELTNRLYRSLIWSRRKSVPEVNELAELLAPHAAELLEQLGSIEALIDSENPELRDRADTFLMMFRDAEETFIINTQP